MRALHYITHPDVIVDPEVPVTRWRLSREGRDRAGAMLRQPWISSIGRIVSSTETKALDTAEFLSLHLGLPVEIREETGENDRSATGFVPPQAFERIAAAFFDAPDSSIRGWERAVDAQARIVEALDDLFDSSAERDIAVIGHGAVGTLWYCHLNRLPIDRRYDQPNQGNFFTVDLDRRRTAHPWQRIDSGIR